MSYLSSRTLHRAVVTRNAYEARAFSKDIRKDKNGCFNMESFGNNMSSFERKPWGTCWFGRGNPTAVWLKETIKRDRDSRWNNVKNYWNERTRRHSTCVQGGPSSSQILGGKNMQSVSLPGQPVQTSHPEGGHSSLPSLPTAQNMHWTSPLQTITLTSHDRGSTPSHIKSQNEKNTTETPPSWNHNQATTKACLSKLVRPTFHGDKI